MLIHYAGTKSGHNARVEAFLERIGNGIGLLDNEPAYYLYKFLLSQRGQKFGTRRTGQLYVLAMAIKAWNLTKTEKSVQSLRLRTEESFPTL